MRMSVCARAYARSVYVCVSECVCVRARVCVCVCARARMSHVCQVTVMCVQVCFSDDIRY